VEGAGGDFEGDFVVGDEGPEALGDADEFERGRLVADVA
jgi:hypothetical protein